MLPVDPWPLPYLGHDHSFHFSFSCVLPRSCNWVCSKYLEVRATACLLVTHDWWSTRCRRRHFLFATRLSSVVFFWPPLPPSRLQQSSTFPLPSLLFSSFLSFSRQLRTNAHFLVDLFFISLKTGSIGTCHTARIEAEEGGRRLLRPSSSRWWGQMQIDMFACWSFA